MHAVDCRAMGREMREQLCMRMCGGGVCSALADEDLSRFQL